MEDLIKASNKRKVYLERAEERKIQKEKEESGEMFADKEEFVTEAYLAKQKELRELEEQERLKEGIGSDTKLIFRNGGRSKQEKRYHRLLSRLA